MYLGLIHHPITNKNGEQITTSVTNLDIHDIARSARTFGFKNYFIVTPIVLQKKLVNKILGHWDSDEGNAYNPDRKSALSFVQVADSIAEASAEIEKLEGVKPLVVVTGANFKEFDGSVKNLCDQLVVDNRPMFLLFGTGWGLHASVLAMADYKLEPIIGLAEDKYNHLSVRSAVAIYCDRIARSLSNP